MAPRGANGKFTKETTMAGTETKDEKKAEAEIAAWNDATHPNGEPKMLTIARPNGQGERRVTVEKYRRSFANPPGQWIIKETEVFAPHHSDDY